MLDFGWSEFLFIIVIAVFLLGPKDIPEVIYQFGRLARRVQYLRYGLTKQFDAFMEQNDLNELRRGGGIGDLKGDVRAALSLKGMEHIEKKGERPETMVQTLPTDLDVIEDEGDEVAFHEIFIESRPLTPEIALVQKEKAGSQLSLGLPLDGREEK